MKTFSKNIHSHLAVFCAGACLIQSTFAAPSKTNSVAAAKTNTVVEIPKSVFDDKAGKDPFFPRRTRVTTTTPTTRPVNVSDFILKGITLGPKPTCIINDYTFEKGEQREIKTASGSKSKIRVVEIKEDSVAIKIEDSPDSVVLQKKRG